MACRVQMLCRWDVVRLGLSMGCSGWHLELEAGLTVGGLGTVVHAVRLKDELHRYLTSALDCEVEWAPYL